jgi:hypothetical protein
MLLPTTVAVNVVSICAVNFLLLQILFA